MPRMPKGKAGTSSLGSAAPSVAVAEYSFATHGGAIGDIALAGDTLPAGAIITDVLLHIDTIPTSVGAATIAVKAEGAADLQAAAAISGAPWSTTGAKRGSLDADTAPVKTTAARTITATVAAVALTAGRFRVLATYIELDA